jgi:HPt (histidine-containing phosphotransfer) domain-containing protein
LESLTGALMERPLSATDSAASSDATGRTAKVKKALEELWEANRGTIAERLSAIRTAHQQLVSGSLSADTRTAAIAAAHKLAGVLGTFGFPDGSEAALQAQLLLETQGTVPAEDTDRLAALIHELTHIAAARTLPTPER